MQYVILLFLVAVGVAAAIVTFPWGIAIALILSLSIYGMDQTVEYVKIALGLLISLAGILITLFIVLFGILYIFDLL